MREGQPGGARDLSHTRPPESERPPWLRLVAVDHGRDGSKEPPAAARFRVAPVVMVGCNVSVNVHGLPEKPER